MTKQEIQHLTLFFFFFSIGPPDPARWGWDVQLSQIEPFFFVFRAILVVYRDSQARVESEL